MSRALFVGVYALLFVPGFIFAQLTLTGLERSVTLKSIPEYPAPHETVHFTIESFGIDIDRSEVGWFVDNREVARGGGLRNFDLTAGALGSAKKVMVVIEEPSGLTGTAQAFVRPTEVEILWESDSYVPPFYRGRALPGTQSTIRAFAEARLVRENGTRIPKSDILYTWYRGNTKIGGGRGVSSITFNGPQLSATDRIAVVTESLDGTLRGRGEIVLVGRDPILELYEEHPLFGTLYHRAFVGDVQSAETEQKVRVVPYFTHTNPRSNALEYAWNVGGTPITPDPEAPDILTILRSSDYEGNLDITLTLTSTIDWYMKSEGLWRIVFDPIAGAFGGNPFSPSE